MRHFAGDGMMHLGSEQLPHHVIVIVDRRADDVNLAGIVRRVASGRSLHHLILLHLIPPKLIQILIGIFIHGFLETEHDLAPAGEDQQAIAKRLGGSLVESPGVGDPAAHLFQPGAPLGQPLEHHGHPFGRQDVRFHAQHVGHAWRNVLAAVNRMAKLVQQGGHPVVVLDHVGQNAHIAVPVDIGAKGMRAFSLLLIEIAAGYDVLDR